MPAGGVRSGSGGGSSGNSSVGVAAVVVVVVEVTAVAAAGEPGAMVDAELVSQSFLDAANDPGICLGEEDNVNIHFSVETRL